MTWTILRNRSPASIYTLRIRRDIWLPVRSQTRKIQRRAGARHGGPARRERASLSSNGRYVAFASAQSGRFNIWLRDLATGKEADVVSSSFVQRFPVINASGSRIAFSV